MNINEIIEISQTLRLYLSYYTSCLNRNRLIEANSYLAVIRYCCEQLEMDWEVVTGIKNGYVFKVTVKSENLAVNERFVQTAEKPQITVREQVNGYCLNPECGKDLSNRRKGTKYCNQECKNACLK